MTMADDTKTPPNELPPSDQPWGADEKVTNEYLSNIAKLIFEYYNFLCEAGLNRPEAFALTQLFQAQYWAVVLNIIFGGKSKRSD